jgi:hypothetical protein
MIDPIDTFQGVDVGNIAGDISKWLLHLRSSHVKLARLESFMSRHWRFSEPTH